MLVRFKFVSLLSVFLLVAFVDSLSEDDINSSISSFSSASAVSGSSFVDESKNVISSLRWNNNDEIGAGFGEPQLAEQNEKVSRPLTNNAVDVNDDRDSDSSSDSDEDDDDEEDVISNDDWARINREEVDEIMLRQLSLAQPKLSRVKRRGRGGGRRGGLGRRKSRPRPKPRPKPASSGYPNQAGGMTYPGGKPKTNPNQNPYSAPAPPGHNYGATHNAPPPPGWNVPNTGTGNTGYRAGTGTGTGMGGVGTGMGMGTGLGMGTGIGSGIGRSHKGGMLGSKGKMAAAGILGAAGGYYVGSKMGQLGMIMSMGRHRPYGYYDGYYDERERYVRCQPPPSNIRRIEVVNGTVIIDEGQTQYDTRCLYVDDDDKGRGGYGRPGYGYGSSHHYIAGGSATAANFWLVSLSAALMLVANLHSVQQRPIFVVG